MIRYEVNLEVDAELADAFADWLRAHVAEMLTLPGFVSAELFAVEQPEAAADRRGFCVDYRLHDRQALDRYFVEHAPRMRAQGLQRFGGRFTAIRRILHFLPLTAPVPAP